MGGAGSCPLVGGAGSCPLVSGVELEVVPLVGRTTSGAAFIEQLCAQEDFKQFIPTCWLLSLRHPSTGANRLLGGTRS